MTTILWWSAGIVALLVVCAFAVLAIAPFILSGQISREEEEREDARHHT